MSKYLACLLLIGEILISSHLCAQELIPYRKGKLWGYANRKKQILIGCQYEDALFFLHELAKVKKNGQWGLIDRQGQNFLPFAYDIIYAASKEGRVVVCVGGDKSGHGGKWGFVAKYNGQEIPLKYDLIRESGIGSILGISRSEKWGGMNEIGKEIIPIQYHVEHTQDHRFIQESYLGLTPENIQRNLPNSKRSYLKLLFKDELARVSLNGLWGFINSFGNPIIPIQYDFVGDFSEDLVCVIRSQGGQRKIGFVNSHNEAVIPLVYDFVPEFYRSLKFQEGLVQVRKEGQWGFVNPKNQVQIPFTYQLAYGFREGLAAVSMNQSSLQAQWQFINFQGKVIFKIKPDYKLIDHEFKNGYVRVHQQGQESFLNDKGNLLIPFKYDKVFPFEDGLAQVVLNGKTGFMNEEGEEVIPLEYDFINEKPRWVNRKTKMRKNGQWGIINHSNRIIVPFLYEEIRFPMKVVYPALFAAGPLPVRRNGQWGFVSVKGKEVIACKYENAIPFQGGYARVQTQGLWGFINTKGVEYFENY